MDLTNKYININKRNANRSGFTLIEIMIVVLIIGVLLAIAFPNLASARETSRRKSCAANLRRIEWAKNSFLMEENHPITHTPLEADIYGPGKWIEVTPQCNGGGVYTIGSGAEEPECDYLGGGVHTIYGE